jgi:hypothetical protein
VAEWAVANRAPLCVQQRTNTKMAFLIRLACAALCLLPVLASPAAAKDTYGASPSLRSARGTVHGSTLQGCARRIANAHTQKRTRLARALAWATASPLRAARPL